MVVVSECFPRGEIVVQNVPIGELAALDECLVVQGREVGQLGSRTGHRHFVHNGVPDEFGVPDDEVKDSHSAGAASTECGGVSS